MMFFFHHTDVKKLDAYVQGCLKLGAGGERCEAMKVGVVVVPTRTSIYFHPCMLAPIQSYFYVCIYFYYHMI